MTSLTNIVRDLRYAARKLAKSPGFTATAVLTLALGIGANTAIFSLVKTALLDPLPYPDSDRLTFLFGNHSANGQPQYPYSAGTYHEVRDRNSTFEGIAAVVSSQANLTGEGEPRPLVTWQTTANLFDVLGVKPLLGRTYSPEEEGGGVGQVVVLSHSIWQSVFAGDQQVIGREILLNDRQQTVIGVMPAGFSFPYVDTDIWMPVKWRPHHRQDRAGHYVIVVGRLASSATLEQARADLAGIMDQLAEEHPKHNKGVGAVVVPVRENYFSEARPVYAMLLGAVGCLLLIACVNVANLLLVRASSRRPEVAVRAALGASRGRLAGQILLESALLTVLGGSAGVVLAVWSFDLTKLLIPEYLRQWYELRLDWEMLAWAVSLSVASGLFFGAIPALGVFRGNLALSLQGGGRSETGSSGQKTRDTLVVAEAALAGLLLIAAGLLLRSLDNVRSADLGIRPEGLLTARVSPLKPRHPDTASTTRFYRETLERIESIPGVVSAGYVNGLPLDWGISGDHVTIEGRPPMPDGKYDEAIARTVAGDYLETVGIRLLRGRLFDATDGPNSEPVAIVDEQMAKKLWPHEEVLGARFKFGDYDSDYRWMRVIGVVDAPPPGRVEMGEFAGVYYPYGQSASEDWWRPQHVVVRVEGPPLAAVPALKEAIWQVAPDLPVSKIRTMEAIIDKSRSDRRIQTLLVTVFAGLALLLAAIGVYGVLAYSVSQRTSEMGLRMALGAKRADVLGLVLSKALKLVGAGLAIACVAALGAGRLLESLLFEVSATDPSAFASAIVLLLAAAATAGLVPGRRASGVEPIAALRHQ